MVLVLARPPCRLSGNPAIKIVNVIAVNIVTPPVELGPTAKIATKARRTAEEIIAAAGRAAAVLRMRTSTPRPVNSSKEPAKLSRPYNFIILYF